MNDEAVPRETSKPTKYFLIMGAIVFIAILAVLFFAFKEKPDDRVTVDYNYFTFEEVGGLWQTNIDLEGQLYEAAFRFNPEQVQDVYITGNFSGFRKEPVYITFDPDAEEEQFSYLALAASELTLHMVRALNVTVEAACTRNETEPCKDRPIVNCEDDESVIYLVPNPPTQITLSNSCIMLYGHEMDLLKSVDRMLFQWYKIIR